MSEIKTVFVGTPTFALPSLKALARDTDFAIKAVITQPDMPSGRQLVPTPPPVKELAEQYHLTVWQPQKIIQVLDNLRELQPEVMVVAAYAQIIPEEILSLPRYGCVNVHPSLLPHYRGATPAPAAILAGDSETGVTIMLMDKTFDTGPILNQESLAIAPDETAASLLIKTAKLGAKILTATIKQYIKGQITPLPQDNNLATYCRRLDKGDGLIDWQQPAATIERLVRGLLPWPAAWTWLKGKQLKILAVDREPLSFNTYKPGKTFIYNNYLAVQCGRDALIVRQLQLEGKKATSGETFINGYRDSLGSVLG